MKKTFDVAVDAGMIFVGDIDFLNCGGLTPKDDPKKFCYIFDLAPGIYKAKISSGSWHGKIKKEFELVATSGKVYVGDPCYTCSDKHYSDNAWENWLEKFEYGERMPNGCLCFSTGGDGLFKLSLSYKLIQTDGDNVDKIGKPQEKFVKNPNNCFTPEEKKALEEGIFTVIDDDDDTDDIAIYSVGLDEEGADPEKDYPTLLIMKREGDYILDLEGLMLGFSANLEDVVEIAEDIVDTHYSNLNAWCDTDGENPDAQ